MIILNLKDGLGNQFFEMAFAKKLQKIYPSEKIYINEFFFQNGKRRFCSLQHFEISKDIKFLGKGKSLFFTILFLLRIMLHHPKIFVRWISSNKRPKAQDQFEKMGKNGLYVTFNTFAHFPVVKTRKKIKFIYGNFENFNYFDDIADELREDFKCIRPIPDKNAEMCRLIENSESVCVHIRRGDYLDPKWASLNVCTFDYYNNAITSMYNLNEKAKFFVFSNTHKDIEWIKENYRFADHLDIEYVDLSNSDYDELSLMARCKHFIISNSTFSWWAAYMSPNCEKSVFIPEFWTRKESEDCSGFYVMGWTKINI